MSTDYFTKICNKEKIVIPAKDGDVRKFLASAGAVVLDTKSKQATELRREHAAAVLWAHKHLDDDAVWSKLKEGPRDTLLALFPVMSKFIDKGGAAWVSPCRSLIRAYLSPPPSPKKKGPKGKGTQLDKGSRSDSDAGSEGEAPPKSREGKAKAPVGGKKRSAKHLDSASDSDAEQPTHAKSGAKRAKKAGGKAGNPEKALPVSSGSDDEVLPPYLSSRELLAVLPSHRKDQLFLGRSWTGAQLAEREKHLERIMKRGECAGRFEDPERPMWAQRITVARGPGSAFSDLEVSQDGRNLAAMLRWDSAQLLYSRSDWDGTHRLQRRAQRVAATWEQIKTAARGGMAPPSALLTPIFRAVYEVLDQRLTSATGELVDAGPAGEEILGDMARQRKEVSDLFASYEDYLAAVYSGDPTFHSASKRAISVWYGLLAPAVAILSQDSGSQNGGGLAAQVEAAFGMTPSTGKDGGSGGDGGLVDGVGGGSSTKRPKQGDRARSPPPSVVPAPVQGFGSPPSLPMGWGWPAFGGGCYPSVPPVQPPPGSATFTYPPPMYSPPPPSPGPPSGHRDGTSATPPTVKKGSKPFLRPVSAAIVGVSRGQPLPPKRPCSGGRCVLAEPHFHWECPLRFVEVFGKAPPGFLPATPAVKDPSAWAGSDLTADTAKAWRDFLAEHPEVDKAHGVSWETSFD